MDADRLAMESQGDKRPLVVVGYDGSASGLRAVVWAAPRAVEMGAVLQILVAWLPPTPMIPAPMFPVPVDGHQAGSVRAHEYAQRAEQVAYEEAPELAIETEVIELPPIQALMNASRNAELLVVGRRGLGGLRGLLLGSVSQHCAEHAHCPVVIIPEPGA